MPGRFEHYAEEFWRLVRYGFVGLLGFVVYVVVNYIAIELLGSSAVLGALVAQAATLPLAYLGHANYSFRVQPNHTLFFWRFSVINALLFAANAGITWLLTGVLALSYKIAVAVAVIAIPMMSYLLNRLWVFKSGIESAPRPSASSRLP
jgi:putative flippase GtrA